MVTISVFVPDILDELIKIDALTPGNGNRSRSGVVADILKEHYGIDNIDDLDALHAANQQFFRDMLAYPDAAKKMKALGVVIDGETT